MLSSTLTNSSFCRRCGVLLILVPAAPQQPPTICSRCAEVAPPTAEGWIVLADEERSPRSAALARLRGPSIVMYVCGGLMLVLVLAATATAIAAYVDSIERPNSGGGVAALVFGSYAALQLHLSPFVIWAGLRIAKLRSYPWVVAFCALALALNVVLCTPVGLTLLWPLFVLLKPEIRQAFRAESQNAPIG